MTFLIDADIERRKALYPEWKTQGIPVVLSCPRCPAKHTRIFFNKRKPTKYRVVCERCRCEVNSEA